MRYVLCRPEGGLNDMLCQIETCCKYGERFDRAVVVDTVFTHAFKDCFENYFLSRDSRLQLTCDLEYPDYTTYWDYAVCNFFCQQTKKQLCFDRDIAHVEDILLHHQCGGGAHSLNALARLRLADSMQEALRERLARIGNAYTGIHIRNTDYRSDYRDFIAREAEKITGAIFIATDSGPALLECQKIIGDRVHSFADLPQDDSNSLHSQPNPVHNRDAILDLLMLAMSSKLICLPLDREPKGECFSGYSVLAQSLHDNKSALHALTGIDHAR